MHLAARQCYDSLELLNTVCQLLCIPCLSGSLAFTKLKIGWFGKLEHILPKTERYIHVTGFLYLFFLHKKNWEVKFH